MKILKILAVFAVIFGSLMAFYYAGHDSGLEKGRAIGVAESSIPGKDTYLITLRPINNPENPILQLRARFEVVDCGK